MASSQEVSEERRRMSRQQVELAVHQIEFARQYTLKLIEDIPEDMWFTRAASCPSHLAWQLGHLAMAQYGLTMLRVRGRERTDNDLLSKDFLRTFKKGSTPEFDAEKYPSISEIHETLAQVHEACLTELADVQDEDLQEKVQEPYAVFDNKLGSLFFCAAHEMLHAGQIGMLRRMLGKTPIR